MKAWDQLFDYTATTSALPPVMVFVAAVATAVALLLLRRLLPSQRRAGGPLLAFLLIAAILELVRLGAYGLGLGGSVLARTAALVGMVLLALAVVGALVLLLFEVIPGRFHRRAPPIVQEVIMMTAFVVIVISALGEIAGAHKIASVITTSAVLTAVIGLALQSTLSNLFAGLALQMDRSLAVGDWIQTSGRTGRVAEIRWRTTLLHTLEGDVVLVPNAKLLADEVLNHSKPGREHRRRVEVGFHYRHPPNEVRRVLLEAIRGTPGVLARPEPDAFPIEFGDSSVLYAVRFWVADYPDIEPVAGEVRSRIWYAAQRAGLEIPFPIRTVHVHADDAEANAAAAKVDRRRRIEALERVGLFASLERGDLELLAEGTRRARFGAGEIIIEQGAPGDSLYVISSGEVRVSLAKGAAKRELATLAPGDHFGEMSLLTGEPRSATCVAARDVECYVVGHEAIRRVLIGAPHLAEEMAGRLSARQEALAMEGAALEVEAAGAVSAPLLGRIRRFFDLG